MLLTLLPHGHTGGTITLMAHLQLVLIYIHALISRIYVVQVVLSQTHGRPKLSAAYGRTLALDPTSQSFFFCLVGFALSPSLMSVFPIISSDLVHAGKTDPFPILVATHF